MTARVRGGDFVLPFSATTTATDQKVVMHDQSDPAADMHSNKTGSP